MKTSRSRIALTSALIIAIAACNGGGSTTTTTTTTGGGTNPPTQPTTPVPPSISIIAPYDNAGDAYFSAGQYVYLVSLAPTSGTVITQVGTIPSGLPVSIIKPYGTSGNAYVAAGSQLFSTINGFSAPFDTVPNGQPISAIAPFGDTGNAYVAAGNTLYLTQNGGQVTQIGQSSDNATFKWVVPYDNQGDAYVAAGTNLYLLSYSTSSGTYSLGSPEPVPGTAPISQILLIGQPGTKTAYISAGPAVYATTVSPLSPVGSTTAPNSSTAPPPIGEVQEIGTSQNAYILAGVSVYRTDGKSVTFFDTANLATSVSALVNVAQLFGQSGNAYLGAGTDLWITDGANAQRVATAAVDPTTNTAPDISVISVMDPAGDAYVAAGADLYAYIANQWSPIGNLQVSGKPTLAANPPAPPIVTQPTQPSCPAVSPSTLASGISTPGTYQETDGSQRLRRLSGHVPSQIRNFSDLGKVDESKSLNITVTIPLNNEADLNNELGQLYMPGSPSFHHFETPSSFRAKYAPTQAQVDSVTSYLNSHGFSGITSNANRTLISAKGKIGAVNSAFHTELHSYQNGAGTQYFAPSVELQVDAAVPIRSVLGLQNVIRARKQARAANKATAKASSVTCSSVLGMGPDHVREVYNLPATYKGDGQTIALYELDGYQASDITAYETNYGLSTTIPIVNKYVSGATGTAGADSDEVTLDIEMVLGIAPRIKQLIVYEGPNTDAGLIATYDQIANDNSAAQVSTSWNMAETSTSVVNAEAPIFQQMAAQGQSVYAASSDQGAYFDTANTLAVADPASQPYVVGVGGTTISFDANDGSYRSESVWVDTGSGSGSGGGVSSLWTIPSWQNGFISGATMGSTTMRNVPDVALDADPCTGYYIYLDGTWQVYGGTSAGTPIWAAFNALVNEARLTNGLTNLGFPNPALYAIAASSSNYANDFHDIKSGNNLYYPAVAGYDDATGLGTINGAGPSGTTGTGLLNDLSTRDWGTTSCGSASGS